MQRVIDIKTEIFPANDAHIIFNALLNLIAKRIYLREFNRIVESNKHLLETTANVCNVRLDDQLNYLATGTQQFVFAGTHVTALFLALMTGREDAVSILLAHGAKLQCDGVMKATHYYPHSKTGSTPEDIDMLSHNREPHERSANTHLLDYLFFNVKDFYYPKCAISAFRTSSMQHAVIRGLLARNEFDQVPAILTSQIKLLGEIANTNHPVLQKADAKAALAHFPFIWPQLTEQNSKLLTEKLRTEISALTTSAANSLNIFSTFDLQARAYFVKMFKRLSSVINELPMKPISPVTYLENLLDKFTTFSADKGTDAEVARHKATLFRHDPIPRNELLDPDAKHNAAKLMKLLDTLMSTLRTESQLGKPYSHTATFLVIKELVDDFEREMKSVVTKVDWETLSRAISNYKELYRP